MYVDGRMYTFKMSNQELQSWMKGNYTTVVHVQRSMNILSVGEVFSLHYARRSGRKSVTSDLARRYEENPVCNLDVITNISRK